MLVVLLGFVIAAAIGLTGVGAGVLTAPALILLLDFPPPVAVGTALAFGTLVKLPALGEYARRREVSWRAARAMLVGGLPGVVLGTVLLESLSGDDLRGWVLLAVGLVVVAAAVAGLTGAREPAEPAEPGEPASPVYPRERPGGRGLSWLSFPIGLEVGFSSAGAGALGTLLLLHRTRLAPVRVVGTDLAFGLGLAAVGAGLHVAFGSWDPVVLVQLLLGGALGAFAGVRLATRVPARPLRLGLLVWLVIVGGGLSYQGIESLLTPAETGSVAPTAPRSSAPAATHAARDQDPPASSRASD